jgi:hypothetical protein
MNLDKIKKRNLKILTVITIILVLSVYLVAFGQPLDNSQQPTQKNPPKLALNTTGYVLLFQLRNVKGDHKYNVSMPSDVSSLIYFAYYNGTVNGGTITLQNETNQYQDAILLIPNKMSGNEQPSNSVDRIKGIWHIYSNISYSGYVTNYHFMIYYQEGVNSFE